MEAVICNKCGAPIQVDEVTRFVTCLHCGTGLKIHETESSRYTEVLESIHSATNAAEELITGFTAKMRIIQLQAELDQLDLEWNKRSPPISPAGIVACVVVILGLVVWCLIDHEKENLVVLAIASSLVGWMMLHYSWYEKSHKHYESVRNGIETELIQLVVSRIPDEPVVNRDISKDQHENLE